MYIEDYAQFFFKIFKNPIDRKSSKNCYFLLVNLRVYIDLKNKKFHFHKLKVVVLGRTMSDFRIILVV